MENRKRKRKNGINSEPTETENSEPRKKKAADKPPPGITILYYSNTIPFSDCWFLFNKGNSMASYFQHARIIRRKNRYTTRSNIDSI